MWIAVGVVGICFAVAGLCLFVWAMRRLAGCGVRFYHVGDDGLTNAERKKMAAEWRRIAETPLDPETRRNAMYLQPRRICCLTPPDTAHTGTCKNSRMRSGQERFFSND